MNELLTRWRLESPQFFKNLAWWGKVLAGAGGAIMAVVTAAPELIDETVLRICKLTASYLVFGGGIIVAISNLTVSDYDKLQKKLNEKDI